MATVTAQRLHLTVELFYAMHIKTIWNMFFIVFSYMRFGHFEA